MNVHVENSNPQNNPEITPMVRVLDVEVVREDLVGRPRGQYWQQVAHPGAQGPGGRRQGL